MRDASITTLCKVSLPSRYFHRVVNSGEDATQEPYLVAGGQLKGATFERESGATNGSKLRASNHSLTLKDMIIVDLCELIHRFRVLLRQHVCLVVEKHIAHDVGHSRASFQMEAAHLAEVLDILNVLLLYLGHRVLVLFRVTRMVVSLMLGSLQTTPLVDCLVAYLQQDAKSCLLWRDAHLLLDLYFTALLGAFLVQLTALSILRAYLLRNYECWLSMSVLFRFLVKVLSR